MSERWTQKFVDLATHLTSWSKDKSTKTSAIIVSDNNSILSIGYNGFPRGVDDSIADRYERPKKYLYTEHAERNAIYNAAAHGISTKGTTMYTCWFPCADCSRGISQAGIKKLVCDRLTEEDMNGRWGDSFRASLEILRESGVEIEYLDEQSR